MVINLATIDFCPGQGSDPVIRNLNVTENGTYRAPAGVDGYNPVNVNVSGGGSITPEEQAALDTLVDASEGVLYTKEFPSKSMKVLGSSDVSYQTYGICDIGDGDVYYYYELKFLKFNKNTLKWDSLIDGNMTSAANQGLWKDASGRFYDGTAYQIDLETKSIVYIDTDCTNFSANNGKTNILYGQYGVWCVNQYDLLKFDEDTQKFVSGYEIILPDDYQDDLAFNMCYRFKYDGHILYDNGSNTYEIVEYEDHIEVVDVTDMYYIRSSFGGSFQISSIFGTDSGLFYMWNLSFYQYDPDNQTWEQLSTDITGGLNFASRYCVTGDFVIGGIWMNYQEYTVINLGDDWKNSAWTAVKNIAVDLSSEQTINGYKHFPSGIDVGIMNASTSSYGDSTIRLGQNNSNIYVRQHLNISVPGLFTLNNKEIAVTDQCILNKSYSYPGQRFEGVAGFNYMQAGYQFYFVTPSGRIIYSDSSYQVAYEFDGTQWIQLQSVTTFVESMTSPVYLNDGLYVVNNNDSSLYRWDDTNSDWEFIIQAPDQNIWAGDANTLRCRNNQKLVNNGGTYQWEEEWVSNFPSSGIIRCAKLGQDYYYMSENMVYTYDTSNLTFTSIGSTFGYSQGNHWFTYDGCMYYFSDMIIRKVDPSQVGTDQWDTITDIYFTSWDAAYVEYDNKIWTLKFNDSLGYNQLGYTYNVTESVPAVPAQDGTYVLKATVLNGAVTYSWVPEV